MDSDFLRSVCIFTHIEFKQRNNIVFDYFASTAGTSSNMIP